jgi:hypothetical protein
MMPLEERVEAPVLDEDSPLRIGLPAYEPEMQWRPGSAEDLNIARIEEPALPVASLASIYAREYSVTAPASGVETGPDLHFHGRSARGLWDTVSTSAENGVEALRSSPETPTEVKYRIWVQPLEESTLHQLERASNRPCPAVNVPGLEAWTAGLDHSRNVQEVGSPQVAGFAVQGLVMRGGTSLQSVITVADRELEYLLYPGSRRVPIPANLTPE